MAEERVTHAIGDNRLVIQEDALSEPKEYIGIDLDKIIVGVETSDLDRSGNPRREIVRNSRGLNEARVAIEAQEIYNRQTRKRRNWFILDLETGRGMHSNFIDSSSAYKSWFPGCVIKGDILTTAEIKASPDDAAETIGYVSNWTVCILDLDNLNQKPEYTGWYHILYDNGEDYITGYVIAGKIDKDNMHYANPNTVD